MKSAMASLYDMSLWMTSQENICDEHQSICCGIMKKHIAHLLQNMYPPNSILTWHLRISFYFFSVLRNGTIMLLRFKIVSTQKNWIMVWYIKYQYLIHRFAISNTLVSKCVINQGNRDFSYSISQEICTRFCFAVLCCGYTLTDFPISTRLTSLALRQSNDCPSASKATLMNMDKYLMWIHYERLHNDIKAKHNKTVCIFLGIYCTLVRWVIKGTRP